MKKIGLLDDRLARGDRLCHRTPEGTGAETLCDAARGERTTSPIERLNGEIRRRSDVIGIIPNEAAVTRLLGTVLLEQNDEWAVRRARYMTLETIAPLSHDLTVSDLTVSLPPLAA